MLHLHFANRLERLCEGLLAALDAPTDAVRSAFDVDEILVPSAALRRWLTLAIADRAGICTQVRFDFLASWLWRQVGRVVPGVGGDSPFAPEVLAWRVHRAFGDEDFVGAHPRLAGYLAQSDPVMRLELAGRVARLIEQYVTYRPAWLEHWQHGRKVDPAFETPAARADEAWQAALWRRLLDELQLDALDPVREFVRALERGDATIAAAGLPPVVHAFALPTMPPLHLRMLQALGRAIEVHLHVLNPCEAYWFDLISPRRLAHLEARGLADHHEVGHSLLAAWGQQTQSMLSQLVDASGELGGDDDGDYLRDGGGSLLAQLQDSMLALDPLAPGSLVLAEGDRSLELQVCHSLTRELEVLQDRLLAAFEEARRSGQPLAPGDILVVTPDLEAAAPLIDAVFGTAPPDRWLPYTITGLGRSGTNAAARALLGVLALAGSRCTATEVQALLQQPIVARRFGLDEEGLARVHEAMRTSGMRWGLDAQHRAGFDLPAEAAHTLDDGMERLFLGLAMPAPMPAPRDPLLPGPDEVPFLGRLPAGTAEGSQALAIGGFWRYGERLRRLQAAVSQPRRPADWAALLMSAVDDFLQPEGDELDALRELQDTLREVFTTMQRADVDAALPLSVLRQVLERALDDPQRGGVPTGGITFSAIGSLRSLPFEVVAAIGLNDGAFPGVARVPEFDLMALQPQMGDRQRREDDRNLFLDLLLSARRSLVLSCTGRSVIDNTRLPPSVLVDELLDTVARAIAPARADGAAVKSARQRLVVEHPLQPFSLDAFRESGDERRRSHDAELAEALRQGLRAGRTRPLPVAPAAPAAAGETGERAEDGAAGTGADAVETDDSAADDDLGLAPRPFFERPLPPPDAAWREVPLPRLVEALGHPCRFLLRRRLRLDLGWDEAMLEDDEPFLPDREGRRALTQRLLPRVLAGATLDDLRSLARAGVEMPGGAFGDRQLDHELRSLLHYGEAVRAGTAAACLPLLAVSLPFELDGETWRVDAAFADLRPHGLVRGVPHTRRTGRLLEAWLHHLLLCAAAPDGVVPHTRWIFLDGTAAFAPVDEPLPVLRTLLEVYRRALREPVHFYPRSAWAYVENGASLAKAQSAWTSVPGRWPGEEADEALRLALRGVEQPLDDDFIATSVAVLGPLQLHLEDGDPPA